LAFVLGIDEAGLSPVLGPLVVSGALFSTRDRDEGGNFWRMLDSCVCSKPSKAAGRLVVADSKTIHKKGNLTRLEEGVFSFLHSRGDRRISNLKQLLGRLDASVAIEECPWYELSSLKVPVAAWRNTARDHGERLQSVMEARGMAFVAAYSEPVPGGQFNRDLDRTRNKAMLLWERVSRIIYKALKASSGHNLTVCVDRLGGRDRYDQLLEDVFEGMRPERAKAGRDVSAYEYSYGGKRVRVLFLKSGEEKAMPVALASMISKYVRELFLKQLNGWFCERMPGLKPTAGYHVDGRRFLRETEKFRRENEVPDEILIRKG